MNKSIKKAFYILSITTLLLALSGCIGPSESNIEEQFNGMRSETDFVEMSDFEVINQYEENDYKIWDVRYKQKFLLSYEELSQKQNNQGSEDFMNTFFEKGQLWLLKAQLGEWEKGHIINKTETLVIADTKDGWLIVKTR